MKQADIVEKIWKIETPRGDGNSFHFFVCFRFFLFGKQKPREGTETCIFLKSSIAFCVFGKQKPREGTETLSNSSTEILSIYLENRNPERGRKPFLFSIFIIAHSIWKIETPRGDGNTFYKASFTLVLLNLENRNPERGRKQSILFFRFDINFKFGKQKPREGTETVP